MWCVHVNVVKLQVAGLHINITPQTHTDTVMLKRKTSQRSLLQCGSCLLCSYPYMCVGVCSATINLDVVHIHFQQQFRVPASTHLYPLNMNVLCECTENMKAALEYNMNEGTLLLFDNNNLALKQTQIYIHIL